MSVVIVCALICSSVFVFFFVGTCISIISDVLSSYLDKVVCVFVVFCPKQHVLLSQRDSKLSFFHT